jgi:hypothetical protein
MTRIMTRPKIWKLGRRLSTVAHYYARLGFFQTHEVRIAFKSTTTVHDLTKERTLNT